jgi:hypothetical protein
MDSPHRCEVPVSDWLLCVQETQRRRGVVAAGGETVSAISGLVSEFSAALASRDENGMGKETTRENLRELRWSTVRGEVNTSSAGAHACGAVFFQPNAPGSSEDS